MRDEFWLKSKIHLSIQLNENQDALLFDTCPINFFIEKIVPA